MNDDDWDVIHTYSRKQAIEDGVLVPVEGLVPDEPNFTREAGWKVPVALTAALAGLVIPTEPEQAMGQSIKGRLWDVLNMARLYGRGRRGDTAYFPCIFLCHDRDNYRNGQHTFNLKAVIGPGDDLGPVMTVMFREED